MTTIWISNWSSHRTPGMHGPGRKFTIMAHPRPWEWGAGRVVALSPLGGDMSSLMIEALTERAAGVVAGGAMDAYRSAFDAQCRRLDMRPGYLDVVVPRCADAYRSVLDGDTLCCACSVASTRAGLCHRAWLAPHFVRAGWRVVLDGATAGGRGAQASP